MHLRKIYFPFFSYWDVIYFSIMESIKKDTQCDRFLDTSVLPDSFYFKIQQWISPDKENQLKSEVLN